MKETVTKIEGGRLLTLIVRASFATLSFTDIRVSGCVSSRHHAKSYLGTASVIYKIRIFWIFMFWGIENCFFLTYLQNKLPSRTHNFRKYQYTVHVFTLFIRFLLFTFYFTFFTTLTQCPHSGIVIDYTDTCPGICWRCWHCVRVVIDYADTLSA